MIGLVETIRPLKITLAVPGWVARRCQPVELCQWSSPARPPALSIDGRPWTVRGQCVSEQVVVVVVSALSALATGPAANVAAGTSKVADKAAIAMRPLRPRRRVRNRKSYSFQPVPGGVHQGRNGVDAVRVAIRP